MADEKQTTDSWIKDGTQEAEPETTETPAVEAAEEVVETATEVATETVETTEAVATEAVAETVEEVVQKFIDAKHGDEAFQLPEGLLVPQTRDGETKMVPIETVLSEGMMETDYRHKTSELSDLRRAFETEQAASQGRASREAGLLDAREKFLAEQEKRTLEALTTEDGALRHQRHLQMYRDDPAYRETWDKSWANRETEAERDALLADQDNRVVKEASTRALGWIESIGKEKEFDGVDTGRVASIYGQRLNTGQASLDSSDVRSIYQAEADYLSRASEPLRDQLASLSAKIDSLTASQAAEEQNETTAHAVQRAKTIPVATGAGAPTNVEVPKGKFTPRELQGRISAWTKEGRA